MVCARQDSEVSPPRIFILRHSPDDPLTQADWFGRGFSYGMERLAFLWALLAAVGNLPYRDINHIHILTDSESLGQAFTGVRDGHATSRNISHTLQRWFSNGD